MVRAAIRLVSLLGVLLLAPAVLGADANTWTRSAPTSPYGSPTLVATSPDDPYEVYGGFGNILYRSRDGGRTWVPLRSFYWLAALLVHPASSSTLYVADGGDLLLNPESGGIYQSNDAGETWHQASGVRGVRVLAGSPTDASIVFAGSWSGEIFRTTDAGAAWSRSEYVGVIASLVIPPRDPQTVYVGAEGSDYWFDTPGSLGKSTDGGSRWQSVNSESLNSVVAIAVDPGLSSTIYAANGPYECCPGTVRTVLDVLRSDDGGASWASGAVGLPAASVRNLVVDPRVAGTVYAGTDAGLYRSRDGGRTWTAFGRQLAGIRISSLTIDPTGRRLHAGTGDGIYELEIASGPIDLAAAAAGDSIVLLQREDRASIGVLTAPGEWTSGSAEAYSASWAAVAVASGRGNRSQVLWQDGGGRSALEIVGPSGRESATVFEARPGWIATDVSARADGATNVLWTSAAGEMFISRIDASGVATDGPTYLATASWSAVAIADGADGNTWVLWRGTDGRAALSTHRDGTMTAAHRYGAYLDWSAEDVAIAADGRPRILRTSPGGLASVVTVDASGQVAAGQRYTLPGFTPRRIAAGDDGVTRLLFSSDDGQGEILLLNADNTLSSKRAFDPFASVVVTAGPRSTGSDRGSIPRSGV